MIFLGKNEISQISPENNGSIIRFQEEASLKFWETIKGPMLAVFISWTGFPQELCFVKPFSVQVVVSAKRLYNAWIATWNKGKFENKIKILCYTSKKLTAWRNRLIQIDKLICAHYQNSAHWLWNGKQLQITKQASKSNKIRTKHEASILDY